MNFFQICQITLISAAIISCSKETETPLNNKLKNAEIEHEFDLSNMTILKNDSVRITEPLDDDNIITVLIGNSNNVLYQFDSDSSFVKWCKTSKEIKETGIAIDIELFHKTVCKISDYVVDHRIDDLDITDSLPNELSNMIKIITPNGNDTKISLTTLFDNVGFCGSKKTMSTLCIPNLQGFRNRTESLKQFGGTFAVYCDNRWFRGKKLYIFSIPYCYVSNLGTMNNRIESIFSCN